MPDAWPERSGGDRDLIAAWLCARSIARGLPQPIPDHGGWRVDTASEAEVRRYVFAESSPGLGALARTIVDPRIFLKLLSDDLTLRTVLPARWELRPQSHLMLGPDTIAQQPLPSGYSTQIEEEDGAIHVRIDASDGAIAASGHAAEHGGVFVYDRIVTASEHQRRGLGRAMMALLGSRRRYASSRQVLVATDQGRALYATLGWRFHAPYASAVIPDRAA